MTNRIEIYDTTLRDGTQGEGVNFSVADKCRVVMELDGLGVDIIEGGWPGSNPRDGAFFEEVRRLQLEQAAIAALDRRAAEICRAERTQGFRRCWRRKRPS
jgi:2-isopropylmalate synthase